MEKKKYNKGTFYTMSKSYFKGEYKIEISLYNDANNKRVIEHYSFFTTMKFNLTKNHCMTTCKNWIDGATEQYIEGTRFDVENAKEKYKELKKLIKGKYICTDYTYYYYKLDDKGEEKTLADFLRNPYTSNLVIE